MSVIDNEKQVIGGILVHPGSLDDLPPLAAGDFSDPALRAIYQAIMELRASSTPIDVLTVAQRMESSGTAEQLRSSGGAEYLTSLMVNVVSVSNITYHAGEVQREGHRRRVGETLRRGAKQVMEDQDVGGFVERLRTELEDLQPRLEPDPWRAIGERWSLSERPPPREYLLRAKSTAQSPGLFVKGRVGMIHAQGGTGKTMANMSFAVGVASGQPVLNSFYVDRPGDVLLAVAEEDEAEARRRLYDTAAVMKLDDRARELAEKRLVLLPLIGKDVAFTTASHGAFTRTPYFEAFLAKLRSLARDWALVIIDPLSRFAGPDTEKDNAAATKFIETLEAIVTTLPSQPNVLVAHHQGKVKVGEKRTARGASALRDGARLECELVGRRRLEDAPALVDLELTKNNYAGDALSVALARDPKHGGALRPASSCELTAYDDAKAKAAKAAEATKGNGKKGANGKPKPTGGSQWTGE